MNKQYKYFEAPKEMTPREFLVDIAPRESIFLAGSITGAYNWQENVAEELKGYYHVFNPRREDFDVTKPEVERQQITWEHKYLKFCNNILFYFSYETLAPITLLEYGTLLDAHEKREKRLTVAIHPDYKRKNDVLIQTELRAPSLMKRIYNNLDEMVSRVITNSTY